MPSTATSRRESGASDSLTLLNSNRPQVQPVLAARKVNASSCLSDHSLISRPVDAPSTLSASNKASSTIDGGDKSGGGGRGTNNKSSNSNASVVKKAARTNISLCKGSTNGSATHTLAPGGGAAPPAVHGATAISTSARPSSSSATLAQTPRTTSATQGAAASTPITRKLRPTTRPPHLGPRFTQPTVSSRAHLQTSDSEVSADVATPSANDAAAVVGAESGLQSPPPPPPRTWHPPFARCSNPVNSSETESQKSLPRSSGIQRGGSGPIEPGATHGKRSGDSSVADSTEAPRRLTLRETAATASAADGAAAPSSASTRCTADPAPTIGTVRHKSQVLFELRGSSQSSQSSQLVRSGLTTPGSTPVLTPAEPRSISLPDGASAMSPTSKQGAAQVLSPPRPPVTALHSNCAPSTLPAQRETSAAAVQRTSSAELSSSLSTPVRPSQARDTAAAAARMDVSSPPPPSRPTVALHAMLPVVYQVPLTETTSRRNRSHSSGPASPSASTTSARAPRRSGSEDGGRRSSSPRTPPPSHSAKKASVAKRSGGPRAVTPLSTKSPTKANETAKANALGATAAAVAEGTELLRSRSRSASATALAATTAITTPVAADVKRRSPSRPTMSTSTSILVPSTPECVPGVGIGVGIPGNHFASVIETNTDVEDDIHGDAAGDWSQLAHSAPTSVLHHRSSTSTTSSVVRGARSVCDWSRSRSPAQENIAALLEDLQVLRRREEAEAQSVEATQQKLAGEEAEAAAQRSHRKVLAAVKGRASVSASADADADADADVDRNGALNTFLFPFEGEAGDEGAHDAMEDGAQERPSRATDTTGHAPITPRLRRRIEEEQQRELELLRTITQERHPEYVDLLDSPDELIRELSCIDADMDPAEVEEALRSRSSAEEEADAEEEEEEEQDDMSDSREVSQPVLQVADEAEAPILLATPPSRSKAPAPTKLKKAPSSLSTTAEKTKMTVTTNIRKTPSHRDDVSATPLAQQHRRGSTESDKTSEKTRDTSRSQRVAPAAQNGTMSGRKKPESDATPLHPSSSSSPSAAAASAGTPASHARPRTPSSRGRQTSTAENSNNNSSTKLTRRPSKAAVSETPLAPARNTASPPALNVQTTRDVAKTATVAVVEEAAERRRRALSENGVGGSSTSAHSSLPEHAARPVTRHGSLPIHSHEPAAGAAQGDKAPVASAAAEALLPALLSPEEAANTVTIVFDLDETLCNNRCLGGTVLRPGAELLLHTLRNLAPSPRYKLVETRVRGQHATNRLYDQAMFKMGMSPLYRPRVAQRQATSGYHQNIVGGSTGEARPASAKETNPLRVELVLWTASEESLARRAMRRLDPHNAIFDEAIYRDLRWYRDSYYTKDLSCLGRSMQRIVVIENSVESVIRNRQNAILVTSFITNRLDRQLFLVREVLRDWIRGMKANLAYALEHQARKPSQEHDDEVRHDDDDGGGGGESNHHALEESHEEGGESPVPPHSTTSPSSQPEDGVSNSNNTSASSGSTASGSSSNKGNGGSQRLPHTLEEDPLPQLTAPAPTPMTVTSSLTLSSSAFGASSNSTGSAPRVLSAAARRASNIVEFLHRHRLVLAESNYINFQMTGEVMSRLQSTEPALITAAIPSTAEGSAARPVRNAPCSPTPRTPRTPRTGHVQSVSAVATVVSTPSSAHFSQPGPSATAAASAPQGSFSSNGDSGVPEVNTMRGLANATVSSITSGSAVKTGSSVSRNDARLEPKRQFSSPSLSTAAAVSQNASSTPRKSSAVRAARETRLASTTTDTSVPKNSAALAASTAVTSARGTGDGADRSVVRPQRTASVVVRRQAA